MYGSGAIATPNRGNGAMPQMFGGVPMYGNVQVPPTIYGGLQHIPRVLYPPGTYYEPARFPTPYGNGRVIPTMNGNGRTVPIMYDPRSIPTMYRRVWSALTNRKVFNNGQLRRIGGSAALPDHDIDAGVPPPQHSLMPDAIAIGEAEHCGGKLVCKSGEYTCLASCMCIPNYMRCDGEVDCMGEDEVECGEYLEEDPDEECNSHDGNVRCSRTGKCIREQWLCDGEDDCGDYSDETHCGKYILTQ